MEAQECSSCEAANYIKNLEEQYDANQSRWPSPPDEGGELPSAEDLLSDLEGFLRDRQRDDGLPAGYCPAKHSCSWSPNPLVRFDARNGWYCSPGSCSITHATSDSGSKAIRDDPSREGVHAHHSARLSGGIGWRI